MKIISLDQRSPDWLAWRNAGIGSSDAAAIVGASPWTTANELWIKKSACYHSLRKVVPEKSESENSAMARGRRLEPKIAAEYSRLFGWSTTPICGAHDEHSFIKASFDGVSPRDKLAEEMIAAGDWSIFQDWFSEHLDQVVIQEIKAPNRDDHDLALQGHVPEKYEPQCHHLLLVAGVNTLHYVSYNDYFPSGKRLAVVLMKADGPAVKALLAAELEFWEHVIENKPVSN